MRTGRPKKPLDVTDQERDKLEMWARRPKSSQRLALRSRIVLRCADGLTNQAVALKLGVSAATVGKWRERFRTHRLEGLADEPRPGAPRRISDTQVEEVVTRTLETSAEWCNSLEYPHHGKRGGADPERRLAYLASFGLKPHRTESFKLSTDPFFVEKVRDIVGLYLNPPDRAMVVCVDEKSQVQALDRTQPLLPMRPGMVERHTMTICAMALLPCSRPSMSQPER